MSCLSWNCRGLGNPATIKELHELAKKFVPAVLCVQETQVHRSRVENLRGTLGFDNAFAISSDGLGIFWNNKTRVDKICRTPSTTLMWLLHREAVSHGV